MKNTKNAKELEQAKKNLKEQIDRVEDVIVFASEYGIALIGSTLDICGATCSLLDKIREEFGELVFQSIIETVQEHKWEDFEKKDEDLDKLTEAMSKLEDLMKKTKGE